MASIWSDEEWKEKAGDEVSVYVHELKVQVETHKARADAAVINAEQNCSLIEQKFLSLTDQYGQLEHEKQQIMATLERRAGELGQAQGKSHKLELDAIRHSSDLDRVTFELSEARKSKRELLDIVGQKNAELDEKNASIKSCLSKIVNLTDERSLLEGKVRDHDAEMLRSQSLHARLLQEKELLEQHNSYLSSELTAKVKGLMEERQTSADLEAELQSKLRQAERLAKEATNFHQKSKERIVDLEAKLAQTREELRVTTEHALLQDNHLSAEIATATKLADLYKQNSIDYSEKANQLEGVVKAIEAHLNQVEAEYREKLDREIQGREASDKEVADLKEKLTKTISDRNLELEKNANALVLPAAPSKPFSDSLELAGETDGYGGQVGTLSWQVSSTAFAATLLRDGWTLGKTYSKYHEAVDALRHETQLRRNSENILERVLREIERKAEVITDEREEHNMLVESYRKMEEKLHYSMGDQSVLESTIKELKADVRKKDRELKITYKEISDLQIQVAGLLKECADVKERYEGVDEQQNGDVLQSLPPQEPDDSAADIVISEKLVTFKDLRGIVEQNGKLRMLLRNGMREGEQKEADLKESYSAELNKRVEVQANKVKDILVKYKEKEEIIQTLHGTMAMFKRLYEEKLNSLYPSQSQLKLGSEPTVPGDGQDFSRLQESSQEEIRAVRKESAARIKALESELAEIKQELTKARVEQARADAEADVAREQMRTLTQNAEIKREEMDSVLLRNMELSQTITNYQQRLRESSQGLHAAEELANRMKVEASILEREKEILAAAERRASEEVVLFSDRAHRSQAHLDTLHQIEEARESMKAAEMKKLQDEWSQMQKEWIEAKKELEVERRHSRDLTNLRDKAVKEASDRVEMVSKELAEALRAMSVAETRAQVAEVRCTEVEANLKKAEDKIVMALTGGKKGEAGDKTSAEIDAEVLSNLQELREALDQTTEDLATAKGHTEQYKRIAEANEEALKQLEAAHNRYKEDVDHVKQVMQDDIKRLQDRVTAVEAQVAEKEVVITSTLQEKETAISHVQQELAITREALTISQASLQQKDARTKTLKEEVDKYHLQWREAQQNYERQILLQADTIKQLTIASDRLTKLEQEESALRIQAETAESQLASLQVSWAMEKSSLESMMSDTDKKLKELEQQNRLLLDRLEAMHITAAEHGMKASVETGSNETGESKEESDLQHVIRYLRRSKETAETEVTLLTQERLRLQRQLDGALRAAEDAQANLRREQENARVNLCSEEEFRSLQAQVREINLMRESNAQLREENRRNFEDSRESRKQMRRAHSEVEPLQLQVKEKEIELEASGKEIELQKAQVQRWQNRVSQLLEKYKAVDLEEHERVKTELSQAQDLIKRTQEERDKAKIQAEASHKSSEESRITLAKIESENNEKESTLSELRKKIQEATQAEATAKGDAERFKRHAQLFKRKSDNSAKEKEDLSKEIENLTKQAEEFKAMAGKRTTGDSRQDAARQEAQRQEAHRQGAALRQETTLRQEALTKLEQVQKESENSLKEKEMRIQLLETSLEKEREFVRKEKALRQRDQKAAHEISQKANQEKKKLVEELETFKREKLQQLEKLGSGADADDSTKAEVEERAVADHAVVNALSEVAGTTLEQIGQPNVAAPVASGPPAAQTTPLIAEAAQALAVDPISIVSETPTAPFPPAAVTIAVPSTSGAALEDASALGTNAGSHISTNPPTAIVVSTAATVVSTAASSAPQIQPIRPNTGALPIRVPLRQTVIQPGGSDRERAMAQLRAKILEKEKEKSLAQASVNQARKNARRLIRPRIEAIPEAGGPGEVAETELESEEEKLLTNLVDVTEPTSVPPQITVVSTFAVPADAVTTQIASSSVVPTSVVQPLSLTQRKRPVATSEENVEDISTDTIKSEPAPQAKRPRAEELPTEDIPSESFTTSLTGAEVQGASTSYEGPGQEDHDRLEVQASDIPEAPHDAGTDAERERPAAESVDVPPQKRQRFINLSQVPSAERVYVAPEIVEELEIESDVFMSEADVKDTKVEPVVILKAEDLLEEQNVDALDIPNVNEVGVVGEAIEGQEGLTEPANADAEPLPPVARSLSLNDFVEMSRNIPETAATPLATLQRNIQDEPAIPVIQVMPEPVKIETSEQNPAAGKPALQTEVRDEEIMEIQEDEAEEGQIVADTPVQEAPPSAEAVGVEAVEAKVGEKIRLEDERSTQLSVPPASVSTSTSKQAADTRIQAPGLEESLHSQTDATAVTSQATDDPNVTASKLIQAPQSAEQKADSSGVATRQSVRAATATPSSTTIHLADRARERAALRRAASNPQSPSARGRGRATRGVVKRATGASRGGRVISTGIRGLGQQGGEAEGLPEAGRGAGQQTGPGAPAGSSEPLDQNTSSSNPYDKLPREGDD